MNKGKNNENKNYACCDESKMTCEPCSFEESIEVENELIEDEKDN